MTGVDKETYLRLRSEYIWRLRGWEPGKPFDSGTRGRSLQKMQEQETRFADTRKALGRQLLEPESTNWTAIGPAPLPDFTNPLSGRATAIAINPNNANIVYLGTAQGGLWRTLDGGSSWTALMDNAQSLAIGAVTIDPLNPSTVFVGTGEGNLSLDSFAGVGLYRIDNADQANPTVNGPFETRVAGTGTSASNGHAFLGTGINRIAVDQNNDNRIFIGNIWAFGGVSGETICCGGSAAFMGLYFSSNALSASPTFSRVDVPNGTSNGYQGVTDIIFEPGSSSNLLIGVRDHGGLGTTGVYRTATATNAPGTAPVFTRVLTETGIVNIKLAINKVGSTVTALAATEEPATGPVCTGVNGVVWKSVDGGATWPTKLSAANGFCNSQCWYDIGLAIDPGNANNIYLGGTTNGPCGVNAARSTDGGTTFNEYGAGLIHTDVHAIAIAPGSTSTIFNGNDGGIWRSIDSGVNWTSVNNAPLNTIQFESLALHPTDRNFTIGGTQDNGTNYQNSGGVWSRLAGGDGGFTIIDQNAIDTTNVTTYHTYYNSTNNLIGYELTTPGSGVFTFRGCSGGTSQNGINCGDRVLFYAPMARGPGNPNTIYFGTDRLYRSTDKGANHTIVSQAPFKSNMRVSAIGISPANDNVRIVGLEDGTVFATTTGANPLTQVEGGGGGGGAIPDKYIARAVIDPNNSNTAYVTLAGFGTTTHVWKTTNLNASPPTWTNASGSGGTAIPDVPVNAFVIDPTNSSNLFAGTDIGVYNSLDSGSTWNPFGTGLPRVAVFDMAIQNPNRVLRVATHGRGMWEISVAGGTSSLAISSVTPPAGRTSGGQQINLTGVFAGLSTVTMGGVSSSWFYTNGGSDTSMITVTTPAHAVGAVQIDLTPTSGNVYSKPNAFAYLTTVFTDNTIMVGQTTAKAQHIIELRQAVDAMRAVAGLGGAPWNDPALAAGNTVRAIHILDLRTYLDDAATRLGYSTSAYTDPGLTSGFMIKRIHIEELRQRIRTIAG